MADETPPWAVDGDYTALSHRMIGEETLGAIHVIVAILLFYAGWDILAWIFVARAVLDNIGGIVFAILATRRRSAVRQELAGRKAGEGRAVS